MKLSMIAENLAKIGQGKHRQTEGWREEWTGRQTGRQTDKQTERLTNRETDHQTSRQTGTHPASRVVRMCRRMSMCSTVGDRVPIWRRSKLLNICDTSLRPCQQPRRTTTTTTAAAASDGSSVDRSIKYRMEAYRIVSISQIRYTHTHTGLTALCPGLPRRVSTRKVKPIWILLKQETVSGSGISWAICKSAPRSRQIAMPAPHHSVFDFKFDTPHYSRKSRRRQQMALIAINKESDGQGIISVTFQGGAVHSVERPIGAECEKCPYQRSWATRVQPANACSATLSA